MSCVIIEEAIDPPMEITMAKALNVILIVFIIDNFCEGNGHFLG
jgi:hypothetical protein